MSRTRARAYHLKHTTTHTPNYTSSHQTNTHSHTSIHNTYTHSHIITHSTTLTHKHLLHPHKHTHPNTNQQLPHTTLTLHTHIHIHPLTKYLQGKLIEAILGAFAFYRLSVDPFWVLSTTHSRRSLKKCFLVWGGLMNCVEANFTQFDAWSFRFKLIRRLLRKKFEQASNSTQKASNCGSNVVYGKFIPC